mmetsp:Transcript_3122/g.6294  ORF Transcript_3122/g.6294 Transcript_3122/m.6294 type:complete len:250 (+) Transcript_3122:86-835(+)
MLANAARNMIKTRLAATTNAAARASPLHVEWVNHGDDEKLEEIYRLRYKVMVEDAKKSKKGCPFAEDHYCIKGDQFRDDYDELPSTGHIVIRHDDRAVASTRIVNGNHVPLEAEKYNWIDVRGKLQPFVKNANNIAEPSRVVACKSVRGTNVVPLMYLHCLDWFMNNNIESFIGMCNTEARPLIEHYSKWAQTKWITDEPFEANEFIEGRKLDMCFVTVGEHGTKERENMLLTNFAPAFAAYSLMKSPK